MPTPSTPNNSDTNSAGGDTLPALEARLRLLTEGRRLKVEQAHRSIEAANRTYDKYAVPLARRIERLRRKMEADQPKPPPVTVVTHVTRDKWPAADLGCEQDNQHYRELLKRGRK